MTENSVYKAILGEVPEGIKRDVMTVLSGHVGNERRMSRQMIAAMLRYLQPVYKNKRAVRLDRMVRLAIAELQEEGYAILSDSGKGGYWLAGSKDEVEKTALEMESRAEKLRKKALALRKAGKQAWVKPEGAEQLRLEI